MVFSFGIPGHSIVATIAAPREGGLVAPTRSLKKMVGTFSKHLGGVFGIGISLAIVPRIWYGKKKRSLTASLPLEK